MGDFKAIGNRKFRDAFNKFMHIRTSTRVKMSKTMMPKDVKLITGTL